MIRLWPRHSLSSLRPPSLNGLLPTLSLTISKESVLSTKSGKYFTACRNNFSLVSFLGCSSVSPISFEPPTIVPPPRGLGIRNAQLPSLFCRVTVFQYCCVTRIVCRRMILTAGSCPKFMPEQLTTVSTLPSPSLFATSNASRAHPSCCLITLPPFSRNLPNSHLQYTGTLTQ